MPAHVLKIVLAFAALATSVALEARSILFVGNSFTYGAYSPVRRYRAETVTDLNKTGIGGVPALFKRFAEQTGLDYDVSLETQGGSGLQFHYDERRALIDQPWDVVILQGFSTLDRQKPGDPTVHIRAASDLTRMFRARNPKAEVHLVSTWSRADLTYLPDRHWSGKPIEAMAIDLRKASDQAAQRIPELAGIVPVGEAWNRAFAKKIADPNPYDGVSFGQISLWSDDQFHGSMYGYYLEALVVFGKVTGIDPRRLGPGEKAADDLGISPKVAEALQQVAFEQIAAK